MLKVRTIQKSDKKNASHFLYRKGEKICKFPYDEKQLLNLAIHFFKKHQRGKIVSKKLLPLIQYKNYDKHLKEDIKKYMKLNPKEAIIFVAEDNEKLIGYIYGQIIKRPKMILDKVGVIEDWFVEETYRGQRIGKILWNKLINWFKKKKCNCLELNVYPTNKQAIDIYHKLGFVDKSIIMIKKL